MNSGRDWGVGSRTDLPASDCAHRRLRIGRVQLPTAGDALQLMLASIIESNGGAGYQVTDGAGDKDVARAGGCHDTCRDVHGQSGQATQKPLALTGVQARAHLDPELPYRGNDFVRAPNCTPRPVEHG